MKVVVYGAGGMGRQVMQIIRDIRAASTEQDAIEVIGYLDDVSPGQSSASPILGDERWLIENPDVQVTVAIGSPEKRYDVIRRLEKLDRAHLATLVHPRAWIADDASVGPGSIVCAGALVDSGSSVGRAVILNKGCSIGHDARLADFVTVAPGFNVSGSVVVGEGADLGTGGAVIQGVTIGKYAVIGACAAVVRDIPAYATAVGVPAKVIKVRDPTRANSGDN